MSEKTRAELESELETLHLLEKERDISDKRYAIKIVEVIVFAMVGAIALYFLTKMLNISITPQTQQPAASTSGVL